MKRPIESDYTSQVAYTRALEAYCDNLPQLTQQEPWCMKMNNCKTKCEDCPVEVQPAPMAKPYEQEPVAFLANGTRFKISYDSRQSGGQIHGIPPELGGRWVAFVAADDDCHLKLTSPPAQQEPVGCEGAVVNGRVYADRLEHDYKFECEAGPLHLCTDWVEFRRCFEWLAQHTSPPAQRKPLTDDEIYGMYNEPRSDAEMVEFARAIEAAHGIKENT